MPRGGQNRLPVRVKQSYFELIRTGMPGAEAARRVGVSMSCGSLWFIDAGSVSITETRPISSRYIDQDDRIEIADGLAAGEPVKSIAARIGKSFQSVYREIARNRKPDGTYQPWFAHNQAHLRRRRPRRPILVQQTSLASVVPGKLAKRWSPEQISRWLRRRYPRRLAWHVCAETIYDAIYRQLAVCAATLRTGRTYRHQRGRGRTKDGALKQCTAMKSIHDRPAAVENRRQAGHWEGALIIGAGQRSAIATLVERKTRVTKLVRLPDNHSAQSVANALIAEFSCLPASLRRTLTWDQGNEMFQHARIEEATGLRIYLRRPTLTLAARHQREHQWTTTAILPKGSDLHHWTSQQLHHVAAELNDRPRKTLADHTPHQLMRRSHRQEHTKPIRIDH